MNSKAWTIIGFILLGAVSGGVRQYLFPGQEFALSDIWFLPVFVFLTFYWYYLDSKERALRRPIWLDVGTVAISIVFLSVYFFRSRGFKRGLLATGVALLVFIANSIANAGGQYIIASMIQS